MNEFLGSYSRHEAFVVDAAGNSHSFSDVLGKVERLSERLAACSKPSLVFSYCSNTVDCIIIYLGALLANIPICLCEPNKKAFERLVEKYEPSILTMPIGVAAPKGYKLVGEIGEGESMWQLEGEKPFRFEIHPDLALLLATSGSTGSAKLVRLSRTNLVSNAGAIAKYLSLSKSDRPVCSLPIQYSYGLSVLNSHFFVGAAIALSQHSMMRPEFWANVDACKGTSVAGVPYTYETLYRLGWNPSDHKSLRYFTQAGGKLKPELIKHFLHRSKESRCDFFVMYGQTEATARISYVPYDRLEEKIGSIGIAIPRGNLTLRPLGDDSSLSELEYSGANVMLGYAEGPEDLAKGDVNEGTLRTGDIASIDDDGFFYISGRLKRFAKLFGRRINLGDIEDLVEEAFQARVIAVDNDGRILLLIERASAERLVEIRTFLAQWLAVTPSAFMLRSIDRIPMTASGKKDYSTLSL